MSKSRSKSLNTNLHEFPEVCSEILEQGDGKLSTGRVPAFFRVAFGRIAPAEFSPWRGTGLRALKKYERKHSGAQALRHAGTQAHRHTGTQACRHAGTQAHRHTGTRAHIHTHTHTH